MSQLIPISRTQSTKLDRLSEKRDTTLIGSAKRPLFHHLDVAVVRQPRTNVLAAYIIQENRWGGNLLDDRMFTDTDSAKHAIRTALTGTVGSYCGEVVFVEPPETLAILIRSEVEIP